MTPYEQFVQRSGGGPAFKEPTSTPEFPRLIAMESLPRQEASVPFSVVLRDFGPDKAQRYVTHCRNDDDGSHYWGHYFDDEALARADFTARCAKYR
jgi:hypothetical protein